MKVLFYVRPDLTVRPAGDTVQVLKTAEYLRARGISVAVEGPDAAAGGFDLLHFWGLVPMDALYPAFFRARREGIPAVLTPIYWDLGRYYTAMGSIGRLRLWNGQRPLRREAAGGSLRVFVSGEREAAALEADVGMRLPCSVVRCGVDSAAPDQGFAARGDRVGVLCAARIGPRKNQAALAEQCAARRLPLTLAGPVGNAAYLKRCLRFPAVRFAGVLSPSRLAAEYRHARVHALAGYAETPGLAALEAAAWGCELAITDEGTAREYFGSRAAYCDPYAPESIGAALDSALAARCQPALAARIAERFSWETCLAPLPEAYREII